MSKFNVGDTVVMNAGINSAYLKHDVEYIVSAAHPHKVSVSGVDHEYNWDVFTVVRTSGELTDKEVFNAIVDGKSLQYRLGGGSDWYNLKYPEKLTLLDVQRGTYRVRPTEVKLECTVPYPEYSVGRAYCNSVRKFSVDFATGRILDYGEANLPSGGVFWSTKEQAEQFRDAVLASLQGK